MTHWFTRWKVGRLRRRGFFVHPADGQWVVCDPLVTWRRLKHHPHVEMERLAEIVQAGQEPATTSALEAVAEVFGVRLWDGRSGLSEAELLQLLVAFYDQLDGLKKTPESPPTSPAPMASVPSTRGTGDVGGATAVCSSDCTSNASASKPGGP